MSSSLRVGVVGTGFGARVVAPVFDATDDCEVVDVVSPRDSGAVGALCRRPDVDLVSVHAPPFLHREVVETAIDAGKAVLCDKPFGRSHAEALAMTERARDRDALALVNFEFRYEPARRRVHELIAADALGAIEHVGWTHISNGGRVPVRPYGWLFDRAAGGGWLGAWGSHALDALRWWLGEVTLNYADFRTYVATRVDRDGRTRVCDAEDGMQLSLVSERGATIAVDSTNAAAATIAPRLVITGSDAVVEVVADARITVRRTDGTRTEWTRPDSERGDPHLGAMRTWAVAVRESVRAGAAVTGAPTFTDGLAIARLMDEIRERAETSP